MNTLAVILAQTSAADELAKDWWNTDIGGALKAVLVLIGILVVLKGIMTFVKELSAGKTGPAVRGLVASLVLAAFAFRPELISSIINLFGGLLDNVISGGNDVVGGNGSAYDN